MTNTGSLPSAKLRRRIAVVLCCFLLLLVRATVAWGATSTVTTLSITYPNTAIYSGDPVTLTATVKTSASVPVSGGYVKFCDESISTNSCDGAALLGKAWIIRTTTGGYALGTATLRRRLSIGRHVIRARYAMNAVYNSSSSETQNITVAANNWLPSTTSLANTGSGGSYSLKATVTSHTLPAPSGTVEFYDSSVNTTLGNTPLDSTTISQQMVHDTNFSYSVSGAVYYGSSIGDVNNDGYPDMAFSNISGEITVALGDARGNLTANQTINTNFGEPGPTGRIALADLTGDGWLDLVYVGANAKGVYIAEGKGDGTFGALIEANNTGEILAGDIMVGDVNGDGAPDIVIGSVGYPTGVILLYNNPSVTSNITWAFSDYYDIGRVNSLAVGDVNGDGYEEIAACAQLNDACGIITRSATTGWLSTTKLPDAPSTAGGTLLGDFNDDGKLDLVVMGYNSDARYYQGDGAGGFSLMWSTNVVADPEYPGIVGDFNGDGHLDFIGISYSPVAGYLFLGDGTGNFSANQIPVDQGMAAKTADFNGDGYDDAIVTAYGYPLLLDWQTMISGTASVNVQKNGSSADHTVLAKYSDTTDAYAANSSNMLSLAPLLLQGQMITITPQSPLDSTFVWGTVTSGTVSATSDSGLDVVLSVSGPATLTGSAPNWTLAATGPGIIKLNASQAGDSTYAAASASKTLVAQAAPTIGWSVPASLSYGAALGTSVLNATATDSSGNTIAGSFAYTTSTGNTLHSGDMLEVGTYSVTVTFTPTDAMRYVGANVTKTLNVVPISPSIVWANPATISYGTALSAATLNASAADSGGHTIPGSFAYTEGATPRQIGDVLPAGSHTIKATFTPTDTTNYVSGESTSVVVTVSQISPTIGWATPAAVAYGTALSATTLNASAADSGGHTIPGSFAYTEGATPRQIGDVLSAGSHTIKATFTPTDTTDYVSGGSTSVVVTVSQTSLTIGWTAPATISYGTALSAATLNAAATDGAGHTIPGTFAYTESGTLRQIGDVLPVGSHTIKATFTPTDTTDYVSGGSTSTNVTVSQASPIVAWTTPAAISPGTALSAAILNATATDSGGHAISGSFVYTEGATPRQIGDVLPAGSHTIKATFTPTDTTDYVSGGSTSVVVTVSQISPTIGWTTPAAISYGTALSATTLNAAATDGAGHTILGTFAYTEGGTLRQIGDVLSVGSHTIKATFTPTDTTGYVSGGSTSVVVIVSQTSPTIGWATPAAISYGTALSATTLNAAATDGAGHTIPGTFAYTEGGTLRQIGDVLPVGLHTIKATFTPTDTTDYVSGGSTSVVVTVSQISPTIGWATPAAISPGTALSATTLNAAATDGAGHTIPGTFAYTEGGTLRQIGDVLSVGSHTIKATFTPTDTTDYVSGGSTSVVVTVSQIPLTIGWATPAAVSYGTALSAANLNATATDSEGDAIPGSFAYTEGANLLHLGDVLHAGSHTIKATFTPTNTTDYVSGGNTSVVMSVSQVPPVIAWTPPTAIPYGTALSAAILNATAVDSGGNAIPGTFAYKEGVALLPIGDVLSAGSHTIRAIFTPTDTTDYVNGSNVQVLLTVSKVSPALTLTSDSSNAALGSVAPLTASLSSNLCSGYVTYFDGPTVLGMVPVSSGQAVFPNLTEWGGGRRLHAFYTGSQACEATESSSLTETVAPNSSRSFRSKGAYNFGSNPTGLILGDYNQDGIADLGVLDSAGGTLTGALGRGSANFTKVGTLLSGRGDMRALVDVNGDGYPDLVTVDSTAGAIKVYLETGYLSLSTSAQSYTVGANPKDVAVGYFNNDSYPDLAVTNYGDSTVTLLLGKSDGAFLPGGTLAVSAPPSGIASVDVNRDGTADLVVTTPTTGSVAVFLGDGNGNFASPVTYAAGSQPTGLAVGDADGDGKPDVVVTNYDTGKISLLQGDGSGVFTLTNSYNVGNHPTAVALGEFNNDSYPDLAVVNNGDGTVEILLGGSIPATTTTLSADSATYGSPVTLTAKVVSASATVDGTVVFSENGAELGRSSLNSGVATLPLSTLAVGTHDIEADYQGSGEFQSSSGSLNVQISPASLTITPRSVSKTYGANAPALSYTITSGSLFNNDRIDQVTLSSSGAATTATVGAYPITASNISGSGLSNYTITYGSGTLKVNPAALTITAQSVSKVYGSISPALGYTITSGSLFNSDRVDQVTLNSSGAEATAAAGTYSITVSNASGSGLSNYVIAYGAGTLTVTQATAGMTLNTAASTVMLKNNFTLTANVSSSVGAPSGTVTFFDGSSSLGSATLSGGIAQLSTVLSTPGSHAITALYSGDMNFQSLTSNAVNEKAIDIAVGKATTTDGSSTAKVLPGTSAAFSVSIAPSTGTSFPSAITLTLSGLPSGATAMLGPSAWISSGNGVTWTLPANTALEGETTITVVAPPASTTAKSDSSPVGKGAAPMLLGLLLLPLSARIRRSVKSLRGSSALLLVFCVTGMVVGISGCGTHNGFNDRTQQNHVVTVTVSSGALSHSTSFTVQTR